jgi:hypothetical protein
VKKVNRYSSIFPLVLIRSGGLPLPLWEAFENKALWYENAPERREKVASELQTAFDEALQDLPASTLRTTVYNARKRFFQDQKLSAAAVAIIRNTPQLGVLQENIQAWEALQEETRRQEILFGEVLLENYRALQTLAGNETLQRALLFASHDLLRNLPDFAQKEPGWLDKKDRQTARSLYKYLTRALFKTSPLSRFTTLQYRDLLSDPENDWPDALDEKVLTTPNVALLPAIYEVLIHEPAFFQSLRLSLNPCIVQQDAPLLWLYFDGEHEAFQEMQTDPVIELVVEKMLENEREAPYKTMLSWLQAAVDADENALQNLIFKLVDYGLLEWQWPERGLSPGWCGALYQYVGFLPSSPLLTETAYLMQFLRTTARILPFQDPETAMASQEAALEAVQGFMEKNGGEMPPITPSQLFFEDVAQEYPWTLPEGTVEQLCSELAKQWSARNIGALSKFRMRLTAFAQHELAAGKTMDFLAFSRAFLLWKASNVADDFSAQPAAPAKTGALIQVFKENGEYRAVVNALYPGGGKMFARWLPLFPASVSDRLREWHNRAGATGGHFPWQGWSNANFQPAGWSDLVVLTPDGRAGGGRRVPLGQLRVRLNAGGCPELFDPADNIPLYFNDLGLEAPETRPPVMQVLWHLGVPPVGLEALWPADLWTNIGPGVRYRRRYESGSLVLARAAWELSDDVWRGLFLDGVTPAQKAQSAVRRLTAWGLPRRFFAQFKAKRERPQYYDLAIPLSVLMLKKNLESGEGPLFLSEMLPVPEQWPGERAMEMVVEWANDY